MNLVYACYLDSKSKIPLIRYNLNQLKPFFNKIILVYSSIDSKNITFDKGFCGLKEEEINLISNKCFDFGKYKFGLEEIDKDSSHVALINDSISVIKPLNRTFMRIDDLIKQGLDYIGIVESEEIKKHYQSWFWVLSKKAVDFFLKNIDINLKDQDEAIIHNEVGISNKMISSFNSHPLFKYKKEYHVNNIFYKKPSAILTYISNGLPFIKNNAFDDRFLKKHDLVFEEGLNEPRYVSKTTSDLIKDYYKSFQNL